MPGHAVQGVIVIVGAGQAGLQAAESLRQEGFEGEILLLGAEAHGPYNRPPLSKKWLMDRPSLASLAIRGPEAIERKRIMHRPSSLAVELDRARQMLRLTDGSWLHYDGLVLATGSRLRPLPLPGAELGGVFGLRSLDDALTIAAALDRCHGEGQPLVVIGGGFIGLEVAATARKRGIEVVVLEGLSRLMSRVVAPIVSTAAARLHESHGTRLVFDAKVTELVGREGRVVAVRTADGVEHPAGAVVVGVGVIQNDELAKAAGLECDRGIVVDSCSRTADPLVTAAGDCTARRMPDGSLLRLESVQNAVEQGKSAAAALMGRERPFLAAPWFWSDQFDLKLQMVGLSHGYDTVISRGDADSAAFSAYYYRAGQLIAVDSLSRPGEHMVARKLLDAGLTPTPQQVADLQFDLASLVRKPTLA
ncbi:MAG TPA: FAD-dependent oxidoreductase [Steroidobacteraceae bacterium]|nr:FAD-dependent oxidoreductase [Steroidobacteraceae bacterium]